MTRETNKRIEKVIVSYNPPEDHNVLWLHPKYRILRMFETGEWRFVNDWGILVKVLKQHRDMLDLLDQRVTDCEDDIFQLNTTVAGLSSTCSNLSKRMTTVESTCSNLENRLKTVEDMVSSNTNLCPIKNDIVLPIKHSHLLFGQISQHHLGDGLFLCVVLIHQLIQFHRM